MAWTWFILYSICYKLFFYLSVNGKCTWTKTLNMHYFVRTLMCRNKKISWKIHRKKRKVTLIILCIWHHRTALRAPVWRHHTQWSWPTRYLMTLKYLNIVCKFSWFKTFILFSVCRRTGTRWETWCSWRCVSPSLWCWSWRHWPVSVCVRNTAPVPTQRGASTL